MDQKSKIAKGLFHQAYTNLIDSMNEKNNAAQFRFTLAAIGILFFTGAEAVRVVFRKDIYISQYSMIFIIVAFLCFTCLGVVPFFLFEYADENTLFFGNSDIQFVTGILYIALAVFVLIKGIMYGMKSKEGVGSLSENGLNNTLTFLSGGKSGWSQKQIQNIGEPVFILLLGIILCFINILAGLPLVACALSVWLFQLFNYVFGPTDIHKRAKDLQNKTNATGSFSEAKMNF